MAIAPVGPESSKAHVIARESRTEGNTRIKISIFNNNITVVDERFITPSTVSAFNPDVMGLSDDGSFFVVWNNVTNDRIEGLRFAAIGTKIGTVRTIASGSGLGRPDLSETGDGRILVTWEEAGDIRTRIFDPRDGQITGTPHDDVLTFLANAASTIQGLAGSDALRSAATRVIELAGGGTDRIAAAVSYALATGDEVEVMTTTSSGGTAAINLTGSERIQTIVGNAGANRIDGKAGSDTLTGLGGADTFVFSTALGASNFDRVTDFAPGQDRIALDDAIFAGLAPGVLSAAAFRANTTGQAQDSHDRIVYNTTEGFLYFDPDGLGGAGPIRFADLAEGLALSASDIEVI